MAAAAAAGAYRVHSAHEDVAQGESQAEAHCQKGEQARTGDLAPAAEHSKGCPWRQARDITLLAHQAAVPLSTSSPRCSRRHLLRAATWEGPPEAADGQILLYPYSSQQLNQIHNLQLSRWT